MPHRHAWLIVIALSAAFGMAPAASAEDPQASTDTAETPMVPTLSFQHGLSGAEPAEETPDESTEEAVLPSTTNLPSFNWTFGLSKPEAPAAPAPAAAPDPAALTTTPPAIPPPAPTLSSPAPSKRPSSLRSPTEGPR